ncbi:MAG: hypothetical protein GY906_33780 [bacterium]|nr:hypothetical protein [bacterium]
MMGADSDRPAYEPAPSATGLPGSGNDAKISSFNRLIGVFTNPAAVFEDIARKPTVALVLVCFVLVSVGQGFIVAKNTDFEANAIQSIEAMGIDVPEESLDRQIESSASRWYLRPALGVVFWPMILLISATVFFLMLKLTGSQIGFAATLSTMLHAYWPGKLVYSILLSMLVIRNGAVTDMGLLRVLKSSLAGYLPESTSWPLMTLAAFADVFKIWGIVLLAMGFVIVARVSKGKAWTAALVPWVVIALLMAGLVALPGLFMS